MQSDKFKRPLPMLQFQIRSFPGRHRSRGKDPNTEPKSSVATDVGYCWPRDGWLSAAPPGYDAEKKMLVVGNVGHETQGDAVRSQGQVRCRCTSWKTGRKQYGPGAVAAQGARGPRGEEGMFWVNYFTIVPIHQG